jgi:hypothetical protein
MSKRYIAMQTIVIAGDECGTEILLEMVVGFTVHPGCKQTMTDPAEEPSIDINHVRFFNGDKQEVVLPAFITDRFTDNSGFDAWLKSEAKSQEEADREEYAEYRIALRERDYDL